MRFRRLVIASKNEHKIAEILDVLGSIGLDVDLVSDAEWPDVAETEDTLEGNALLKAREVRAHTGFAVVADDTGLQVKALDGAPGVLSARYAGPAATDQSNLAKLLAMMDGVEDRSARFRTVMVLIDDDDQELVVEGVMEGSIATAPRGSNGFGYDPVFEVGDRTFAEMATGEKNQISHRARALRALGEALSG